MNGHTNPPLPPFKEKHKLPPHSNDAERTVLGQLLVSTEAYYYVSDILYPHMFYKESHRIICQSIIDLCEKGKEANILTVMEDISSKGKLAEVGGPAYISELSSQVSSHSNIENHVLILANKYIRRQIINNSQCSVNEAYDESIDTDKVLSKYQSESLEIGIEFDSEKEVKASDGLKEYIEKIGSVEKPSVFIPTHHEKINEAANGFGNSQFIVLAARPSHGKSAFIQDLCCEIATNGNPVAFFSLEMSRDDLMSRLIARETGIAGTRIMSGKLNSSEWQKVKEVQEKYRNVPLYFDDTHKISITSLTAKARRLKKNKNISMLVIDYLQLITGNQKFEYNQAKYIGDISNKLKQISKELDIPVVALSQLSREVEKRKKDDRFPVLSDLRDSGEIEQDADVVMFLTNFSRNDISEWNGIDVSSSIMIDIAKCRHGKLKTFILKHSENKMRYYTDKLDGFESLIEPQDNKLEF